MASVGDSISHEHEREFAELKRSRSAMVRFLVALLACLGLLLLVVSSLFTIKAGDASVEDARSALLATQLEWTRPFVAAQGEYSQWLRRHGTATEVELFDHLSLLLFRSGASYGAQFQDGSRPSLVSQVYFGLHGGVLRMAFLVVSSWRLWLVVVVAVMVWSFYRLRVHTATDLLGLTGNGRLFYSGARVDLSTVTPLGAPDLLIPGLACPTGEAAPVVRNSELGRCLDELGALNDTTLSLAGIVLKRGGDPAYVADVEEEESLRRMFPGATLLEQTKCNLRAALELHGFYRRCMARAEEEPITEDPPDILVATADVLDASGYAALLRGALHRVLTPRMRLDLARLSPYDIAVLVLGLESGKVMVHVKEGGRWIRRSRFPQLCARAFVHSIPSFGKEFDFAARQHIRRAFVYGSRKSDFAPVRFPLDFAPESRAARQWVEILMAVPHQLAAVADEVELLALVTEGYQRWHHLFFEGEGGFDSDQFGGSFATHGNMFLMPLAKVLPILRRAVEPEARARMETLMASVSNKQRLFAMANDLGDDGGDKGAVPAYERVMAPLAHAEMKTLADVHGFSLDDARDWSALRLVLNTFGWLARRVGDSTVPESSVVLTVLNLGVGAPGANGLGLLGVGGLVPIRASHVEEMWGRGWRNRLTLVEQVRMAENRDEYEKLLRGIDEREEELRRAASGPVSA